MDSINVRVAKRLLEIKAVFLRPQEPFTWASGIKSPIYCDNRLILTAPEARNEVEQAIADTVKREYPEAEVLMGTATAGIAHAAIAAHLLGLPMGEDVCYTNHAEADQDDMDMLLTLLGVAGCNFVMGIPGADDIMLGYQSTSFHDVAWLRRVLGKRPAPEFEAWLERMGILSAAGELLPPGERRGMAALGRELEEGGHGN